MLPSKGNTLRTVFGRVCEALGRLEEKCGADANGHSLATPSSAVRGALGGLPDRVERHHAGPVPRQGGGDIAGQRQGRPDGLARAGRSELGRGGADAREDAFWALLQVAECSAAPSTSPVAYALEQAVRWGRMPLPDLLTELIPEPGCEGTDIQGGGHQTTGAILIGDLPTAAGRPAPFAIGHPPFARSFSPEIQIHRRRVFTTS